MKSRGMPRIQNKSKLVLALSAILLAWGAWAEAPYAFRQRLTTVHRNDRRDDTRQAAADEFAFRQDAAILVAADAPALVRRAAADFQDYLVVSMGINASVRDADRDSAKANALTVSVDPRRSKKGYETTVTEKTVTIVASDARMAAQAFYHLEDLMNARRGPYLKKGVETRQPIFDTRMTFSGYGNDIFPDAHLNQLAHHGFTCIEVWLADYDVISQGERQDVNALIDRAAKYGLDVKLSPRNRAFVHPDDPKARETYDKAYGALAKYYPKAFGIGFCGEVCEFPSKDPRADGRSYRDTSPRDPNDKRPHPGWFPCSDWADWAKMVSGIVCGYNPSCRFIFSTYNWGNKDAKARADLIAALPKGVTLIPVFEMFENHVKRNGLVSPVADYSLAFSGPGKYFLTEAAQAKAAGLELFSNCNSAGLTWDFGNIPYQPAPWQWKKKWEGLKAAHARFNLTGLRENHEYGWYPSFIAELEKEFFCEGGLDFDACLRRLAARDFGEANVEKALEAWRLWSRAAEDYVPTDENQYGPCRIGAAYPFNFFGPDLQEGWKPPKDFPLEPGSTFQICFFDFAKPIPGLGMSAVTLDPENERKEIELFENQVADYAKGAELMASIAASLPEGRRDEAVRQTALARYLKCACQTVVNLKRGRQAFRRGDRAEVERLARLEYANAEEALSAVDADSRLGWLASSGYTGGRPQIEWKLRKMRELYGAALLSGSADRQMLWPEGKIPDFQDHQIAAMTDESGRYDLGTPKEGFVPADHRAPFIDWYPKPAQPNGGCVILVSGGSYMNCCDVGLVKMWKERFTALGFQCVNLVYRTPRPRKGLPVYQSAWEDGQRAIRLVRLAAKERGFDPEKIGIIGMSAGGHLVTMLATSALTPAYPKVDDADSAPCHLAWAIANAPAYNTATAADGTARPQDGTTLMDLKVNPCFKFDAKTCPISFHHGAKDPYTPNGSTRAYRELRKRKIPSELHLYADRGHGAFGLDRAIEFLRQLGFVGALADEVALLDRKEFDGFTAKVEREALWPEGTMPDVSTNQTYAPYLEWHLPKNPVTKAIQIVFPGGGYYSCTVDREGVVPAKFFNSKGMAAVVVKYRTPRSMRGPKYLSAWQDAQRAIRMVRHEAASRGLDPGRIGIMGFSAGGHLTLLCATSSLTPAYPARDAIDRESASVAWAFPTYPAYALTDGADIPNVKGGNEDDAFPVPEFAFDEMTPPMCFNHGDKDHWAAMNSVKCWEELRRRGRSSDLHTYATRGHCFQFKAAPGTGSWSWMDRLWDFLSEKGFNK